MIALIIEDGTGVANANSYIGVEDLRLYAGSRGITLPTSDDVLSALLVESYDFLATYECQFSGARSFPDLQTGPWPRTDSVSYGAPLSNNVIPNPVKTAQMQIAIAANSGVRLFPNQTGAAVKRQKVGPIEREFDTTTWDGASLPILSNVETTLKPLSGDCGQCGGPIWKTVRV